MNSYLTTEDGRRNAARFIKALQENRVLCVVKHVSASGMTREISVNEITVNENGYGCVYQFNYFLHKLGYTWGRSCPDSIKIGGCGMDMRFHLLYTALCKIEAAGIALPDSACTLADNFNSI